MSAIVGYATYVPGHRVQRAEIGKSLGLATGSGGRVVASFDEDSTTMGVEAARALLMARTSAQGEVPAVYLATTSPAYVDKSNATAIHAALRLPRHTFAADLAGAARSGMAAWRAAAATGGLAVFSDVRVGRPGSADERHGGDGAAALLFGRREEAIVLIVAEASTSGEFLDRWRSPADQSSHQWEDRFGFEEYAPLVRDAASSALEQAGIEQPDHVVLTSPSYAVSKRAAALVAGASSTVTSPIGHAGVADVGVGLADALDRAAPGETILLLSAADGCDAVLLRATDRLGERRQAATVQSQLAGGSDVPYGVYLGWRGLLDTEPPRRPEPERPAGPPSARARQWKFGFTGSRCQGCGFVHLPPTQVCKKCGITEDMAAHSLVEARGTVATYTVDQLAFSPSPPLIDAVVDFDGGGRYTLEVADAKPDSLAVGARVVLAFRRLFTAGGVHNYFWKARLCGQEHARAEPALTAVAEGRN